MMRTPPPPIPQSPPVPTALKPYRQFIVWRWESQSGRVNQVRGPYNPCSGDHASGYDPSTWGTYEECRGALARVRGGYSGTGFVFTFDGEPFFLDLDACCHLIPEASA